MKKLTTILSILLLLINGLNAQQKMAVNPNRVLTAKQIAVPDLQININSIEHDKGNYTINYTLKNVGGLKVDLGTVVMQGSILFANNQYMQPAGGSKIISQGTLEPGAEIKSTMGITPQKKLIKNTPYTYQLKADEFNSITEQNENNNIAVAPIIGYSDMMEAATMTLVSPILTSNAAVDLTVEISNITPLDFSHRIYYKVKNIGNATLTANVNGLRLHGSIWCTELRAECLSSIVKLLKPGEVFGPGQEINGYIILDGLSQRSHLKRPQEYTYKIFVDYIKDVSESNENNNIAEHKFTAIF